jgi:hypothetical protein
MLLSVVLYGHETWSVTLIDKQSLMMFFEGAEEGI